MMAVKLATLAAPTHPSQVAPRRRRHDLDHSDRVAGRRRCRRIPVRRRSTDHRARAEGIDPDCSPAVVVA